MSNTHYYPFTVWRTVVWVRMSGLLLWAVVAACSPANESPLFSPSGQEAWIPGQGDSFQTYVERNETRIREVLAQFHYNQQSLSFGENYPLELVVSMRAPYELGPRVEACAETGSGAGMGFLLIHGLTDSPYLLRSVAESLMERFPCAIARGLLLPGHGTVPGDTLKMRHQDWMRVTEFGVETFRADVDELYLVGFSTGTSLSVRYADAHRDDTFIKGLIMLSPALEARSRSAYLAPYVRWFSAWLGTDAERDAARYESFSVNAGAEFYLLTRRLMDASFRPLSIPVFMAGSGDDSTVSMDAARRFFCEKSPESARHMIWYSAQATGSLPSDSCPGMTVVAAESVAHRVYSLSHTGITLPPEDSHYGLDAHYRNCLHYGDGSPDYFSCVNEDEKTVYGERNLAPDGRFEGNWVRRGSFNPHYDSMVGAIACFVDPEGKC
jgi:esterase/lipase